MFLSVSYLRTEASLSGEKQASGIQVQRNSGAHPHSETNKKTPLSRLSASQQQQQQHTPVPSDAVAAAAPTRLSPRALELFRVVCFRHSRSEVFERLRAPVGELFEAAERWCTAEFEWASASASAAVSHSGSDAGALHPLALADVPRLQPLAAAIFATGPADAGGGAAVDAEAARSGRRSLLASALAFTAFVGRLVERAAHRFTQPPARVVSIAAWRSQLGGLVSSLEQLQCCLLNALLNFLFQCHLSSPNSDSSLPLPKTHTGPNVNPNTSAYADSATFQLTSEFYNAILLLYRTLKSTLPSRFDSLLSFSSHSFG